MNRTVSRSHRRRRAHLGAAFAITTVLALGAAGCGDTESTDSSEPTAQSESGASAQAESGASEFRTIDVDAFNELISTDESVVLIDMRTPAEFNDGHIAGATNIDFESGDFDDRIADLDPEATYAIYCRSGNRSGQALDRMKSAGFTQVTNLDGGTTDWTAAGLPLE